MKLPIAKIRREASLQPREAMHAQTVEQYAESMREGAIFPPVVVFQEGKTLWLADGYHRIGAAEANGEKEIDADVREGTLREATIFSLGANGAHGLPRTNKDKRRAVERLLADEEWRAWSDRRIAKVVGVTHPFVATLRRGAGEEDAEVETSPRALATVATRLERRCLKLRDELLDVCGDKKMRVLLEDTLLRVAKDLFSITEEPAS